MITLLGLLTRAGQLATEATEPREKCHRAILNAGMLTCYRCLRPIHGRVVVVTDGEGRRNYHAGCVPAAPEDYSGTGEVRI